MHNVIFLRVAIIFGLLCMILGYFFSISEVAISVCKGDGYGFDSHSEIKYAKA